MHHFQLEVPRNPLHPKHVCTNLQNPRKELNTRRKKSSTLYNNLNSRCNNTDTIFISICSRNLPTFMYRKIPKLKIGQNILQQTDVHCRRRRQCEFFIKHFRSSVNVSLGNLVFYLFLLSPVRDF